MGLIEAVIYNFSGLSTDTKPLEAAGMPMPNGSRFREVDTGLTYYYNTSDSKWYLYESNSKVLRLEYLDGNVIYRGINKTHKAATDAETWVIYKYTYTGSDLTMVEGPLVGSWVGRAALDWA